MSLLSADPADSADLPEDSAGPVEESTAPEPAAPAPDEPGTRVELPQSRRARAKAEAEAISTQLKEVMGTVTSLRDGLSARDRELSELRGYMQAQSQQPRYTPPPQAAPPDESTLLREAKQALDNRDFDTYHAKTIAASEARVMRNLAPALQQIEERQRQQQSQSGGMHPEFVAMFAAHPDVATHPRHVELLNAKNQELDARGVPPGPGRMRQIFAEVDAIVKAGRKSNGGQQFSTRSAGALSGVPTSRGGGGGGQQGEVGVTLNGEEARIAAKLEKAGIMSRAEYAKGLADQDPSRLQR